MISPGTFLAPHWRHYKRDPLQFSHGKYGKMMLFSLNMFKDAEKCTICSPLIFFLWFELRLAGSRKLKIHHAEKWTPEHFVCVLFTVFCDILTKCGGYCFSFPYTWYG